MGLHLGLGSFGGNQQQKQPLNQVKCHALNIPNI